MYGWIWGKEGMKLVGFDISDDLKLPELYRVHAV